MINYKGYQIESDSNNPYNYIYYKINKKGGDKMTIENIMYFINKIDEIEKKDVEIFANRLKLINKNINIIHNKDINALIVSHSRTGYAPKIIKIK